MFESKRFHPMVQRLLTRLAWQITGADTMKQWLFIPLSTMLFLAIVVAGCSGGGSGGSPTESGQKQAALNFQVLSTAPLERAPSVNALASNPIRIAAAQGQNSSAGLQSLKYYITDISICKNMTINGTGYSGQSGCIRVYSAESRYDYDTFVAEDAARETEHYVDLMNSSELAKLSNTIFLSNEDIGDYHYGKVDHYRPVKLTAAITLTDDTVVYTKSGSSTLVSGSGIDASYVTRVSDITSSPAEEAIVVLPNGGSWFKFEKPFRLTAADVQNETTFQMKLAFNPDGVVKAYDYTSSNQAIQDAENNYGIVVPLMPFTPVIYRSTETAKKESYLFSYTPTNGSVYNPFDFRLELYTVAEDANDSIYAADTLPLLLRNIQGTGTDVTQIYRPFSVAASDDDPPRYAFNNWMNTAFITGFRRGSSVGDTGTADYHVDLQNSITMDVLLRSIETIEADSTVTTLSTEDLSGRWTGECTRIASESQQEIYDFDKGNLQQTTIFYTDTACMEEKERLVEEFKMKLIAKTTTDDGQEQAVKQIDLSYVAASLTPKTDARAGQLTSSAYCDYTDWQKDAAKSLLGRDHCLDTYENDLIYEIYRISDTALYFGDTPAMTAANRPTALAATAAASYSGDIP